MIPLLKQLNALLAEPAHVDCPVCKGRCESYSFDRERTCRMCGGKGQVKPESEAEA